LIVPTDRVAAGLRGVAQHGRFFDLVIDAATPADDIPADSWLFSQLSDPSATSSLEQAVQLLARRLGAQELRPVASLLHMSVAAQVCSPGLATAGEYGFVPLLEPHRVRYGFTATGAVNVWVSAWPTGTAGSLPQLAAAVRTQLDDGPLAAFATALNEVVPLSPRTLRGNIASTLVAASEVFGTHSSSEVAGRARELVGLLLEDGPLRDAGSLTLSDDNPSQLRFRRHNCCHFYRIPGGGTCGDCVLTR
jgi:ferric iron reductase protein FhuF